MQVCGLRGTPDAQLALLDAVSRTAADQPLYDTVWVVSQHSVECVRDTTAGRQPGHVQTRPQAQRALVRSVPAGGPTRLFLGF